MVMTLDSRACEMSETLYICYAVVRPLKEDLLSMYSCVRKSSVPCGFFCCKTSK